MGGSNLAAAILDLLERATGENVFLLDSTDTDAIREVEAKLHLGRTLFVLSHKSGKRIETHCLLLYFLNKLKAAGVKRPGKHFIARTEGTAADAGRIEKHITKFFHEGNTQANFGIPAERLDNIVNKRRSQLPAARVTEESMNLYAEGRTRRMISNLSLREALCTFLELRNRNSYIAILPFLKLIPKYIDILQDLRDHMRHVLEMPVQVSSGPRYIHALGKLYRDEPANGIFMVVTAEPREDVAIPGADYTFGELHLALAMAESEALENSWKPTIRLHLAPGAEKGLKQLRDVVIQAVAQLSGNAG